MVVHPSICSQQQLGSAEAGCLDISATDTALGTWNFAVAGAKIWNSLLADLLLHRHYRTLGQKLITVVYVPLMHLRMFIFTV